MDKEAVDTYVDSLIIEINKLQEENSRLLQLLEIAKQSTNDFGLHEAIDDEIDRR